MNNFEYAHPQTEAEAIDLLGDYPTDTVILAGGTDLINLMKREVLTPKRVVDIKQIESLHGLSHTEEGLLMGVLTTLEEINDHPVMSNYQSLLHVVEETRAIQIQSMGTIGGDLCHLPHCWYYRNGYGLFGTEKNESLVAEGENRYHAILGNSGDAKYVSASRFAPPLIAWNAKVRIIGPEIEQEEWLPLKNFYQTPSQEQDGVTILKPGQLLTHILIPHVTNFASATYEVLELEGLDTPLAGASVMMTISNHIVQTAQICLSHVAPVPWLSHEAGEYLVGKKITENSASQAADIAMATAIPLSDNNYKIQIARTSVKRAILRSVGM